jgi:hypothetical protein
MFDRSPIALNHWLRQDGQERSHRPGRRTHLRL